VFADTDKEILLSLSVASQHYIVLSGRNSFGCEVSFVIRWSNHVYTRSGSSPGCAAGFDLDSLPDDAVHCEPVSAPNSHASCPPNIWALAAQSAMACGAEACPRSRLDDAVPEDHPMREIAAVLDLLLVYSELASYYPRIGRPMFSVSHSTAIIIHHGTSSRS
jgi:hypothetical protein